MKKRLASCTLFALLMQGAVHAADCDDIGTRLNDLASADQQIRHEWRVLEQNAQATAVERDRLQQRWRIIDGANLKQLKQIIAACGWPRTQQDSHSAWLLAQHADSDVAFQRSARSLLEQAVRDGIGAPRDLAYLADRIAANEDRPQEYGTQFMRTNRCDLTLLPVDDRALANRRRLAIGLPSLEEYEAEARRRLPADCSK